MVQVAAPQGGKLVLAYRADRAGGKPAYRPRSTRRSTVGLARRTGRRFDVDYVIGYPKEGYVQGLP
ncbi:hypothetical protein [Massilia putida]|uniref:hypothetical protein n=1 Tax=Massilia putida TaxID=1141883 RepID=UPI0012EC7AA4|nr:hypothetical protein [Massilia putida]